MRPSRVVIDRIEQTLLAEGAGHPHFKRTKNEIWITEQPGRQFEVKAIFENRELTIYTETWHGHFDDGEQARQCFMWLLTPYYRLVEIYVGEEKLCDRIERYDDEGWIDLGQVFYINPADPATHALASRETWRYVIWQQKLIEVPGGVRDFLPNAELDDNDLPPDTTLGRREFEGPPESFDWVKDLDGLDEIIRNQKPPLLQRIRRFFKSR